MCGLALFPWKDKNRPGGVLLQRISEAVEAQNVSRLNTETNFSWPNLCSTSTYTAGTAKPHSRLRLQPKTLVNVTNGIKTDFRNGKWQVPLEMCAPYELLKLRIVSSDSCNQNYAQRVGIFTGARRIRCSGSEGKAHLTLPLCMVEVFRWDLADGQTTRRNTI